MITNYEQDYPDFESPYKREEKGRRKIKIEYIADKSKRHITFSKRKAGIMKKAYELSTLTGTQVLLLVASETGHVYTFATNSLQPLITSQEGKQMIQNCLNENTGIGSSTSGNTIGQNDMHEIEFENAAITPTSIDTNMNQINRSQSSIGVRNVERDMVARSVSAMGYVSNDISKVSYYQPSYGFGVNNTLHFDSQSNVSHQFDSPRANPQAYDSTHVVPPQSNQYEGQYDDQYTGQYKRHTAYDSRPYDQSYDGFNSGYIVPGNQAPQFDLKYSPDGSVGVENSTVPSTTSAGNH